MDEELEKQIIEIALENIKSKEQEIHNKSSFKFGDLGPWLAALISVVLMIGSIFVNFYDMKGELRVQQSQITFINEERVNIEKEVKEIKELLQNSDNCLPPRKK